LIAVKSRLGTERNRMLSELETFRQNIRNGEEQSIAKHLFKAGVYFASLDNGLSRNPSVSEVIKSLERRLVDMSDDLRKFLERRREVVEQQASLIDVEEVLRGILKRGRSAEGLLKGNGERELLGAKKGLVRLERLEAFLASWRAGLLGEPKQYFVKIVDMHD